MDHVGWVEVIGHGLTGELGLTSAYGVATKRVPPWWCRRPCFAGTDPRRRFACVAPYE